MSPRTGMPREITTVEKDKDSRGWNCVMMADDACVTFAALDKDHAEELAALINSCAWVQVYNRRGTPP